MKHTKKLLSIILAAILLVSCCSALFTAVALEKKDHLPQIYVNGIGSRAVYYTDDPEKKSLFYPVDMDRFLGNLKRFGEYAGESLKNLDPNVLYNCVYSWLFDSFGMIALDTDGFTSVENVTIDPCPLDYTGDGKYHFNYDSRLDPVDLAKQLDEYVGWVQEHSGSDRFELVGSSYGTSIVMAYLNEYPESWQYVDSVVLCVPSLGGVDFVGQVFSGDFTFDAATVADFASISLGNEDLELLLSVLNKSGALQAIIDYFLDPALRFALLDAVRDIVHDVFGTLPAMWTFVQDEYFYEALEYTYGEDYASPDEEYAELISKITYYHEEVMVRAEELFEETTDYGIKMNIICKYGRPPMPLSEHGNYMSDGLVDVFDASFGATSSMYGEVLDKDYQQALYPEYDFLSDDGCIDASTGALPFNTWYIKGLEHGQKTDAYFNMINTIAYEDPDVFTDPAYPQFVEVSADGSGAIVPLTPSEPKKTTTLLTDFLRLMIRFLRMVLDKLTELLGK